MTLAPSGPIYLHFILYILELEFSSLMNWIFEPYTGSKNQVQTLCRTQKFLATQLSDHQSYFTLPRNDLLCSINWGAQDSVK